MVIEIDPKKIAKRRRGWIWYLTYNVLAWVYFIVLYSYFDSWSYMPYWALIPYIFGIPYVFFATWRAMSRILRYRRTNHHLFLDETGLSLIIGHSRVDIPWADVERVTYMRSPLWKARRIARITKSSNIKVTLRKDTPYNKRTYRLYADYELPLYDIYTEIETLWKQGKGKLAQ